VIKEILIGLGAGVLVYLAINGFDITPLILIAATFLIVRFLLEGRNMGGKEFRVVDSEKKSRTSTEVTFSDVGGQEVAKREFLEALDFVRKDSEVKRLGIRPLKGILLSGPPGTGKTLMAKAAASYTDSVFLATSGSQFVEMYAGVGAQRVRKIFNQARDAAEKNGKNSAIIFIDEIEVLGGKRGKHSSHLEYDQTLNQLLVEMDGISVNDDIRLLVVGATNRADLLDEALMRPGRFDRVVKVDLPDKEGRAHILRIHSRGKPLAEDVDLEQLARDAFGFSGAHLESLVNEAAINAMRARAKVITMEHFRDAVDKVMMGERLDRKPLRAEMERIAYHETGHALISELVRPGSVSVVTITSRGKALGYTRQTPESDRYLYTKQQLLDQIRVTLGGAVSEEIHLGDRSTGSAGDIEEAVKLAKRVIFSGMSSLGVVSVDDLPGRLLHKTIQALIAEQEKVVARTLKTYRSVTVTVVERLLCEEKLSGHDFRAVLRPHLKTTASC